MLRRRSRPDLRDVVAIASGLVVSVVVAGVDIAAGRHTIVIGVIVVAPILTMVLGSSRATRLVAVAALAAALASGLWDHVLAGWPFVLRSVAVAAGGALAVIAAREREASDLAARRLDLLMRLAKAGQVGSAVPDTVTALGDLLVPEFCDACIVDAVRAGVPERLGVRASGLRTAETEAFLWRRGPEPVTAAVSFTAAVATGDATLIEHVDDEMFVRWSRDEDDLAQLRALRTRSAIILPLLSRGQLAGVLTLLRTAESGRLFGENDLEFATVLGGRVALALDNAGLSRQLSELERRMASSLESLVEAVIIQDPSGAVFFANDAALRLAAADNGSTGQIATLLSELAFFDEKGESVSLARLPAGRMLAGEPAEPMLVRALPGAGRDQRWLLAKSSAVRDERGQLTGLVSIFEDVTVVERVEQAQRLLAQASEALASSLDYSATLGQVARLTTRSLADWCTVSLPDRANTLHRVAVAVSDGERAPAIRALLARTDPGALPNAGDALVLREGSAQIVNDITDAMLDRDISDPALRALLSDAELGAVIIVPLTAAGRSIGVMTLCRTRTAGRFVDSDLAIAREIGHRAGTAIENARLYTERTRIATLLQKALRPPALTAPRGWSASALYEPAGEDSEAGGDFYDVFPVPAGHMAFIGDVTGHGPEAARLTSLARYTLRTAGELTGDPLQSMRQLNATLRNGSELLLATAVCIRLDERPDDTTRATVITAGHPLPFVVSGGELRVAGVPGTIAGLDRDPGWMRYETELRAGDTLVLYTDGVTDTRRGSERFGETRLADCLRSAAAAPGELVEDVRAALAAFRTRPAEDDVALVALRFGE
jgi:GAF domain-containing protein